MLCVASAAIAVQGRCFVEFAIDGATRDANMALRMEFAVFWSIDGLQYYWRVGVGRVNENPGNSSA